MTHLLPADRDTIVARATPAGPGGIGVVRLSGPAAWRMGRELFRPARGRLAWPPPARRLLHGHVVDPRTGEAVDEVLCAFMQAPHTYSTEDTVELQGHAGPAVQERVLELCLGAGARLAEPGEFTRRAYLGGRLGLDQAEAVAALVAAQSRAEARLAAGARAGALGRELAPVREALLSAAAAVEAAVDFPDELEGPETADWPALASGAQRACRRLERALARSREARVFREGVQVVLCGLPNVGKSSLFNALLRRRRAIVTAAPGTTRDAIEESAVLGGVVCRLVDTAGLAEAAGEAEALGVQLARERLAQAEVALVVLDAGRPLAPGDREILAATAGRPRVVAANKADLPPAWEAADLEPAARGQAVAVSATQGQGLDALATALGRAASGGTAEPAPGEAVAGRRQAEALGRALEAARRAAHGLAHGAAMAPELVSVDLAEALACLGEVDGQGAPDEVIEAVFRDFCVGK
jgi:tRNA modification GTPase